MSKDISNGIKNKEKKVSFYFQFIPIALKDVIWWPRTPLLSLKDNSTMNKTWAQIVS